MASARNVGAGDSDSGPDLISISNAIVDWMDSACRPVQVFFRVPFRMRFASDLRAPAKQVWQHATSVRGINQELAPWVRMSFPARVRLPAELSSSRSKGGDAAPEPESFDIDEPGALDALLDRCGEEEVEGLLSVGPIKHLCTATLLAFGMLPFDRHALGLESLWRERHNTGSNSSDEAASEKESGDNAATTDEGEQAVVAGFDEVSSSLLQSAWTHSRTVTHVPATAVAGSSDSSSSSSSASAASPASAKAYTRVTDEVSVSPRSFLFLLFPLIFLLVWLTFRWRHFRLRCKFGVHAGPASETALAEARAGLKTKSFGAGGFAALARRTTDEEEQENKEKVNFVPPVKPDVATTTGSVDDDADSPDFELIDRPPSTAAAAGAASDSRKKK
jgi:hypothetical protein